MHNIIQLIQNLNFRFCYKPLFILFYQLENRNIETFMKKYQTIIIASLTSTSLIMSILYWLYGYFKAYFIINNQLFDNDSQLCQVPVVLDSLKDQIIYKQWITLILIIGCAILQLCVLVLLCSKNKINNHVKNAEFCDTDEQDGEITQTNLKQQNPQKQTSINFKVSYKENRKIFLYFVLLFILILISSTVAAHHVKNIIFLDYLKGCLEGNELIQNFLYNNILLITFSVYISISSIIRSIVVGIRRKQVLNYLGNSDKKKFENKKQALMQNETQKESSVEKIDNKMCNKTLSELQRHNQSHILNELVKDPLKMGNEEILNVKKSLIFFHPAF